MKIKEMSVIFEKGMLTHIYSIMKELDDNDLSSADKEKQFDKGVLEMVRLVRLTASMLDELETISELEIDETMGEDDE